MRRMKRPAESTPACLTDPELTRFSQLTGPEKQAIRDALLDLQQECCAYCERAIGRDRDDGHIEHLWRQKDYPELEVQWSNLFFSCMDPRTCGKSKDGRLVDMKDPVTRRATNEQVLAPDRVDVDHFLRFLDDGAVVVRDGLDADDAARAATTLELFNLNSDTLVTGRRKAIGLLVSVLDSVAALGPEITLTFAEQQRAKLAHAVHATAIRQFLTAVIGSP